LRARLGATAWATAAAAAAVLCCASAAHALPPVGDGSGGFSLSQIGSLDTPIDVVDAPGKKNRKLLFLVSHAGPVYRLDP
jgi:hypothetical protein